MRVTIVNWDKFNARKDVIKCHWFRIDHDVFENPAFYGLEPNDWAVLLYLLCQASKQSSATVEIHFEHAKRIARLSKALIESALKKLQSSQFVHVHVTDASVTNTQTCLTRQYITEQNKTEQNRTEQDIHSDCVFLDFESLYQKYPRKIGKSKGLQICEREIKTEIDFEALSRAIDRYREYVGAQGLEEKFIKHFSSFMNSWRDWLDYSPTPPTPQKDLSHIFEKDVA